MAKKRRNTARDFGSKRLDLGDGFVLDMKVRVGGLEYLEDVYDKPVEEIPFNSGRIKDMIHLFTALAISTYPDKPVDALKQKVRRLDTQQLRKLLDEVDDVFTVQAKNSGRPSNPVKGNLTEQS